MSVCGSKNISLGGKEGENKCEIFVKYSLNVISMIWVSKEEIGLMIISRPAIIMSE
jgi:hypothetical protein